MPIYNANAFAIDKSSEESMSTTKSFASHADVAEKRVSFERLSEHAWAYTAEGDPNTGVIIGDDAVLVADTQATPAMAADVVRRIREVTDKPIKYVVLTHYHAVRVLGASAYQPQQILASQDTYDLIVERGEADKASEIGRFPRLFRNVETVPAGLTWPTMTFTGTMTVWLGKLEVQLLQLGRGHTKGDTVVWLPQERTLLSGDLVEFDATPYAGDAYFQDWPQTLANIAALKPLALVPGRGAALKGEAQVQAGLDMTRAFVSDLYASVKAGADAGRDLKAVYRETYERLKPRYGQWVIFDHCMPFDVTRAYDEATQFGDPRVWTAERDQRMWETLEG
jgi:glyoxylase-like metal-dependent hydrolase (beta-lactamase superfamily II)